MTEPAVDLELVEAVIAELSEDERNVVLILYACRECPVTVCDVRGRLRSLCLLTVRSTLSRLGLAVGKKILADDPEARR